jgi:hypothetical protein
MSDASSDEFEMECEEKDDVDDDEVVLQDEVSRVPRDSLKSTTFNSGGI